MKRLADVVLRAFGWRVDFSGLPGPKGVLIVYPHTSNWDFVVGILAKWAMGMEASWIGKHTLFWWPFSLLLRRWGGIPVERGTRSGIISDLARRMREADKMWLALSPEGTRSRLSAWKSGFYHLAAAADVPVGLAYLDYGKRRVGVTQFIRLSGDPEADMARIAAVYADVSGRRRGLETPIRFAATRTNA